VFISANEIRTDIFNDTVKANNQFLPKYIVDEDSFIFFYIDDHDINRSMVYCRQYIKSNKSIEIGRIPKYAFTSSINSVVRINDSIYLHISVYDVKNSWFKNVIYEIDINQNTLNEVFIDSEHQPITTIYEYKGNIISLLNKRTDDMYYTSINFFDIDKKKYIQKSNEYTFNEKESIGCAIVTCCTYKDYIYAFIEERTKDSVHYSIKVFDEYFTYIKSISISNIEEYITKSLVNQMVVIENFIYLRNFSATTLIGKIIDNAVMPLVKEQAIIVTDGISLINKSPYFFIEGTDKYFFIDFDNNSLISKSLNIDKNYYINFISTNDHVSLLSIGYYDEKTPSNFHFDKAFQSIVDNSKLLKK